MSNAWVIAALNNEDDTTVDFVYSNDGTLLPVGADIPNPLWIDDGVQTTPDLNGEDRYLPFDVANWNNAEPFLDSFFPVETVRSRKAEIQSANLDYNIEMRRVLVTIAPV